MKRNILHYLSFALILLAFSSCKKGNLFTPASSGAPYEMLVIIDSELWERPAGRALFDVLDTDVPGLPQSERSFRISHSDPEKFDRIIQVARNIIMVDIQDTYTQPKLRYFRNVYAQPQMVMRIQAPNEEEFERFVLQSRQVIIDFFVRAEMNRQINIVSEKHNDMVVHKVDSIFGCQLWVPTDLEYYKVGKDFFWASTHLNDKSIIVYSYPYTDTNTFTREYFIHKRDSVMKENLPGSREGMYMMTDTLYVETKDIMVRKEYAQEARGLWAMKGDMMGGPFVSHARVDQVNGRVVVVEAFVFAPDKPKRNLMRTMEASLYTLQLPQDPNSSELPMEGVEESTVNREANN